jgi:hypothetical protein
MTRMTRTSRQRSGLIAATLVAVLIDGARSARLLANDEVRSVQPATRQVGRIEASVQRLAWIEASRLMPDQPPAAAPVAALCRASLVEKVGMVFSLGVGSIMFGYGLREKAKHDTIWTPDGKSEVVLGAAAIGLSFWLLQDIRHRARACAAVVPSP